MKKIALIVAGGTGLRMGSIVPKQFLLLKGRPILMHTIERFHETAIFDSIVVVLPENEIPQWRNLIQQHSFTIVHNIVAGGNSRFESVKRGLETITDSGLIAIHDGVRPLTSTELIENCMSELQVFTNAIPVIPIVDSIRKIDSNESEIVDRSFLRAVQTPQCFHLELIKKAYSFPDDGSATDDASVFEKSGQKIHLVDGQKSNLKITVVDDIMIAEALLS